MKFSFFSLEKNSCVLHGQDFVMLGFAGVYPFFLFLLQNIDFGYSLERYVDNSDLG